MERRRRCRNAISLPCLRMFSWLLRLARCRSASQVTRLVEQYAETVDRFDAWYSRCMKLLELDPAHKTVAPADIAKAVELIVAQEAEGQAHIRRAEALLREITGLGGTLKPKDGKVRVDLRLQLAFSL